MAVSTHAPARGATYLYLYLYLYWRFNPRTRTGCDLWSAGGAVQQELFQPTHPHGVRPFS